MATSMGTVSAWCTAVSPTPGQTECSRANVAAYAQGTRELSKRYPVLGDMLPDVEGQIASNKFVDDPAVCCYTAVQCWVRLYLYATSGLEGKRSAKNGAETLACKHVEKCLAVHNTTRSAGGHAFYCTYTVPLV